MSFSLVSVQNMLLIINTQDSFVYNLVEIVRIYGKVDFDVVLPMDLPNINGSKYDAILLSPGAGLPQDYPQVQSLLKEIYKEKSIFGVCLGLQFIADLFGQKLVQINAPKHGHISKLEVIKDSLIFNNVENNCSIGRYHSWVMTPDFVSDDLEITALDEEGNVMAVQHKKLPIYGVQFHPESIISTYGRLIVDNWLDSLYKNQVCI